ncbi:glycosyltransferase [Clostridium sp. B9]
MDVLYESPMKSHSLFLFESLTSIINQSYNDWELLIFSNNKEYISNLIATSFSTNPKLPNDMIKVIEVDYGFTIKDMLITGYEISNGKFLCPINYHDILHKERIKRQVELIEKTDSDIVSSLEIPLNISKNILNESIPITNIKDFEFKTNNNELYFSCNDSNKFITKEEIDFACLSSYIPLDLYTFMIKRSFLKKLKIILSKKQLKNELHLILFLLSYTEIEKAKDAFTYIRIARIPHEENINIDNSSSSNNIISVFNRYKTIENRKFLKESVEIHDNKPQNILTYSESPNIKILIPIEELNIGGTETYILSLCKALINNNLTPYILTAGGILEDIFILNNINIIKSSSVFLKEKNSSNNSHNPTFPKLDIYKFPNLKELKNIIKENSIDILLCHGPNEINLCYELKREYSIPVLATIHGTFYSHETIYKAASIFESLVFVSKMTFLNYNSIIKEFNENHFYIIPNSISIETSSCVIKENFFSSHKDKNLLNILFDKITNSSTNSFKNRGSPKFLTYCSRLSLGKSKLALLFLKSFEELLKVHKNIYALILGEGKEKIKIIEYANKINSIYGTKVFVIGSVRDVDYFYKKSYAVIGTGRVALEALRLGTPVFALGLSGFKGLVCEENIEDMIDSNFGDHIDNSSKTNLLDEVTANKLREALDYFLNSLDYDLISTWCQDYVTKNLNIDITSNKLSNIILGIYNNFK